MSVRPFCALCEAAFQVEEDIVNVSKDVRSLQSAEFGNSIVKFTTDMLETSETPETTVSTPSSESSSSESSEHHITYSHTSWDNDGKWQMTSHPTCVEYLTGHGLSPWRVAQVLAGDFGLSLSATARRRTHLQKLASIGNYYISRISNEPIDGTFSILIKPAVEESSLLYVAHDHLGIRKMVYALSQYQGILRPAGETDLWWETISFNSDHPDIEVISDGIKLRALYRQGSMPAKTYWQRPLNPHFFPRVVRLNRGAKGLPMVKRMRSLILNDVGMKSLSAAWQDSCLTLFAHYPDSPEINYQDYGIYGFCGNCRVFQPQWFHFVLDEGEQITEIWRWQKHSRHSDIVMRTSNGRIWSIGTQETRQAADWDHLINLPVGKPSTIYFDESQRCINQLAFHGEKPLVGATVAPEETVTPHDMVVDRWRRIGVCVLYFSERLTGLSTITPCWIKETYGPVQIMGFVLSYMDGRVRTVGQVRLDCLAEPIDTTASYGMSLKRVQIYSRMVILDIQVGTHKVEADGWTWFPWKGKITWHISMGGGGISVFHEVP
ncbi:hypothetical protein FPOAC1_011601 [Fusarium poae]|uniref:hypothetical protein n=1 Tax=Fusarium poae TaxID=36050 RepID=UPI001CE94CC0|nr:hypothetical protein FPOAC1_011601 [Fusarium poae]KAG8666784.1 hypothetical protein FPOAC1_011601 [Fusarium poae]